MTNEAKNKVDLVAVRLFPMESHVSAIILRCVLFRATFKLVGTS